MTRWYKCPRCIRYCVELNKTRNIYKCGECLKSFTKNEFEISSRKEFGRIESEHE